MKAVDSDRTPESTGVRSFSRHLPFVLLFLLILALFGWYGDRLLVVLIPENGLPVRSFAVKEGEEWRYHYTHSVQQTPVDEYFRTEGSGQIILTHTTYESLGVGLPYAPDEGRFTSLKKEGKFDIKMDRPYQSVRFRTAVQARPKIIHGDTVYDLCELYGQGTVVEMRVMKRYRYWLLRLP